MTAPAIPDALGTPAERVALGAQWLDAQRPGWWQRIQLDRLLMAHPCQCVLGQEYGDFYRVRITYRDAVAYGFDANEGEFDALQDAWVDLVTERREGAQPA